jgi:hypothetical protein
MRPLRAHSTLLATALATPLALILDAQPGGAESASGEQGKLPYLVKIHADWCGAS